MKNLFISLLILFVIFTASAQEKYYCRVKNVTTSYGKVKTVVSTISITIDEEYKSVSVSIEDGYRYDIIEITTDSLTGKKTAKLKLKLGSGLLEALVTYDALKAVFSSIQKEELIVFNLRIRPSISID